MLTVGDSQQCAVWCVHVTSCHVVPLSRPINGGIVLDIKLLENKFELETDKIKKKEKCMRLLPLHILHSYTDTPTIQNIITSQWC